MPLTPEEVREACACICDVMALQAEQSLRERECKRTKGVGRKKRAAFRRAAQMIRSVSDGELILILQRRNEIDEALCAASSAARDAGSSC